MLEYLEAQEIAPYPTWGSWRHQVEEAFGIDFKDGVFPGEPLLHKFYLLRRGFQKAGNASPKKMEEFWLDVGREQERIRLEDPGFEFRIDYGDFLVYIERRTSVGVSPVKLRRRR